VRFCVIMSAEEAKVPTPADAGEPDSKRAKTDEASAEPAPVVTPAPVASNSDEPQTKRLKATSPDEKAVRKQIEYYLSDENLRYDKFFHEKIAGDAEGWLDIALLLSCNKMKALRASVDDVHVALETSKLELGKDGSAVRRPANAALPALEIKPHHAKKGSPHAHDGGVVCFFSNIPEEQSWMQVKDKLKTALPDKVNVWFVSEVSEKHECIVCCAPFEGDQAFFEGLALEVGGAKLRCELAQGEKLGAAVKILPKNIKEKREKSARQRQKERNRPILVGNMKFINVGALRGRVREILNSRSEGEALKNDGNDFKLVVALLRYHPNHEQKAKSLKGIKVAKSEKGDNRCFWVVHEDDTQEDFSMKKCLDNLELNPPYEAEKPKATPKAATAPAPPKKEDEAKPKVEEAKPEEAKVEDPKTGEAQTVATKQSETEATKEEATKEETKEEAKEETKEPKTE